MSDLIRREDAIDAIECVTWYHQNSNKDMVSGANSDEHQAWYKAEDIYDALEAIPSADRPQGEWIEQEDCWQCSECGDEFVLEVDVKPIDARMHYCPNCGARMKGAEDDEV